MWNLPPPRGFQGLREDLPLSVYIRHLPHWRQDGATYFVTYRLNDSLPKNKRRQLESIKRQWEQEHPAPQTKEVMDMLAREVFLRVERWLDAGYGECVLRTPANAELTTEPMHQFDSIRYELGCYVVMLNHVHVVVRPTHSDSQPLEQIVKSWKSHSGRHINEGLSRTGALWQAESYDRIIRNEEHLWRVIQYIGDNPRHAGLSIKECPVWIRPEWEQLGWRFEVK